jgi:hypothetical protein
MRPARAASERQRLLPFQLAGCGLMLKEPVWVE